MRDAPTLLVPVESDRGLEEAHTEALIAWAKSGYSLTVEGSGRSSSCDPQDPDRGSLFLIWYAVRAEPEVEELPDDGEHGFRRWRRSPRRPRDPRRGPHPAARGDADCPPGGRTRVVTAPAPVRVAAHGDRRGTPEPARR